MLQNSLVLMLVMDEKEMTSIKCATVGSSRQRHQNFNNNSTMFQNPLVLLLVKDAENMTQ